MKANICLKTQCLNYFLMKLKELNIGYQTWKIQSVNTFHHQQNS